MKNKHKSKKPRSLQEKIFDVLIYGMAILLILLIIYPLWFVIIASFLTHKMWQQAQSGFGQNHGV